MKPPPPRLCQLRLSHPLVLRLSGRTKLQLGQGWPTLRKIALQAEGPPGLTGVHFVVVLQGKCAKMFSYAPLLACLVSELINLLDMRLGTIAGFSPCTAAMAQKSRQVSAPDRKA